MKHDIDLDALDNNEAKEIRDTTLARLGDILKDLHAAVHQSDNPLGLLVVAQYASGLDMIRRAPVNTGCLAATSMLVGVMAGTIIGASFGPDDKENEP